MTPRAGIGLLSLMLSLTSPASAQVAVLLKGAASTYDVPARYLKPTPVGYGNPAQYDQAFMLSLLVPLPDAALPAEEPDDRLQLQLFADKRYDPGTFRQAARSCLEGGFRLQATSPFWTYQKSSAKETETCYFTFDPQEPGPALTQADYEVRVSRYAAWKLGDRTITPRPSCSLSIVRDGVLIHAGAHGAVCAPQSLAQLVRSVDQLLERWRRK